MKNGVNIYRSKSDKNKKETKIYQIWKGNNKFCLNGKIYVPSELYLGILTTIYLFINYLFYILIVIKVSIINIFIQEIWKKSTHFIYLRNNYSLCYYIIFVNLYFFRPRGIAKIYNVF